MAKKYWNERPRKSAAPSQAMKWNLFPGVPHICRECAAVLRIVDVGEHRWNLEGTTFLCKSCQKKRVEEMVAGVKERLGLA
jgi:hypothetical protein